MSASDLRTTTMTTTTTSSTPAKSSQRFDSRWLVVIAVPVAAYAMGVIALPRPLGLQAEQRLFDRSGLGADVTTTPTTPTSRVDVTLGKVIALRGADVSDRALSRGARLAVALHFAVADDVGQVEGDWQVFLHIDAQLAGASGSAGGGFRIHGDHWPLRGQYKTGMWRPGEFIVDRWEGTVPMDAPSGVYDVWAGLYRGDDRMPVTAGDRKATDGENRVKVGSIVIE